MMDELERSGVKTGDILPLGSSWIMDPNDIPDLSYCTDHVCHGSFVMDIGTATIEPTKHCTYSTLPHDVPRVWSLN